MATLTPTLTLTSTDAFAGQAINLSVTDSLSITAPYTDISKMATNDDIGNGAGIIIADEITDDYYVYVKNTGVRSDGTDANATNDFILLDNADAEGALKIKIFPGEFAFFGLAASDGTDGGGVEPGGLKVVKGGSNEIFIEYAYFKKTA